MPSLRVVKKGVNRRRATSARDARRRRRSTLKVTQRACVWRTRSVSTRSARACSFSIAWMPLRARLSSTCSTIVRSHTHARRRLGRSSSMRVPLLRACSRTSGSTASISRSARDRLVRLLAAAHEVVHALDDAAGALGLLGDALQRLAQQCAGVSRRRAAARPAGSASRLA